MIAIIVCIIFLEQSQRSCAGPVYGDCIITGVQVQTEGNSGGSNGATGAVVGVIVVLLVMIALIVIIIILLLLYETILYRQ